MSITSHLQFNALTALNFLQKGVLGLSVEKAISDDEGFVFDIVNRLENSKYLFNAIKAHGEYSTQKDNLVKTHYVFVLMKKEDNVGAGHCWVRKDGQAKLSGFGIATAHQKKGWGTQFLAVMLLWMRKKGAKSVYVRSSDAGLKIYEKFGFKTLSPHCEHALKLDFANPAFEAKIKSVIFRLIYAASY